MTVQKEYLVGGIDHYVVVYEQGWWGDVTVRVKSHPPDRFQKGAEVTHLYSGGKLCISTAPSTIAEAEVIAKAWMESFSNYVRTGHFPSN